MQPANQTLRWLPAVMVLLAAVVLAVVWWISADAVLQAFGGEFTQLMPWIISLAVTTAVIGFFFGTSLTRRRIVRSLLRHNELQAAGRRRQASPSLGKRRQILSVLFGDTSKLLFANCSEVRNYMSEQVERVDQEQDLQAVADLMTQTGADRLFVCQNYDRLVGVVSQRDLRQRQGTRVKDVMTRSPVTISPSTCLREAVEIMLGRNLSCLPVCLDDRLVGAITTMDLILTMECAFDVLQELAGELRSDAQWVAGPEPTGETAAAPGA